MDARIEKKVFRMCQILAFMLESDTFIFSAFLLLSNQVYAFEIKDLSFPISLLFLYQMRFLPRLWQMADR